MDEDPKAQGLIPWTSYTEMNTVVKDARMKHAVQLYSANTGFPKANKCSAWLDLVVDEEFKYHLTTP